MVRKIAILQFCSLPEGSRASSLAIFRGATWSIALRKMYFNTTAWKLYMCIMQSMFMDYTNYETPFVPSEIILLSCLLFSWNQMKYFPAWLAAFRSTQEPGKGKRTLLQDICHLSDFKSTLKTRRNRMCHRVIGAWKWGLMLKVR